MTDGEILTALAVMLRTMSKASLSYNEFNQQWQIADDKGNVYSSPSLMKLAEYMVR